jgi:DNA helicase-2/ATP-dependent DNA helicase PcrA
MPLRSVELNKEQEAATIAPLDNIRVIAGPGSGKTRVLVSRILHLINNEKIKPSEILAVTFTKRAALELYSRVINNKNIQDSTAIKMLTTSTLHSFCSKILRIYSKYDNLRNDYSIYDESDCKKIVRNVLKEQQRDLSEFSVPLLIEQISLYKRTGDLGSIFPTVNDKSIAFMEIFKQYRATLVTNNAKDFDDLILDTLKILQDKSSIARQYIKNKYRHLLIDEFQDIGTHSYKYTLIHSLTYSLTRR